MGIDLRGVGRLKQRNDIPQASQSRERDEHSLGPSE